MTEKYFIKQYARRWLNLLLFVAYTFHIGLHWAQFSALNDSIAKYYNVPHAFVEWIQGLYALSYILFVGPGIYAMDKFKFRHVIICVCVLSTTGAWIKVFSVVPDRFIFVFVAQFLISISYTFLFSGSARLIATWFGVHECSRASATSLIGDQIGSAVSFIIPVMMVSNSRNIVQWEGSLRKMHIVNASLSTLFLFLVVLLFKDKPKNPPSVIQTLREEKKSGTLLQSVPKMLKNGAFLMLVFWYSVCCGLFTVLGTVLGEIITANFPNSSRDAGSIGFIMTACGMGFSMVFGHFMDRTKKFKEVGIMLTTGSFISFVIFTVVLKMNNIIYVYLISFFVGICMATVYACGIQIGMEIVYPIPEDHCSGVMLFAMQLSSLIFLPIYSTIFRNYGDVSANLIICSLTFAASVAAFLTPVKLNRQEAEELGAIAKELQEFIPDHESHVIKY